MKKMIGLALALILCAALLCGCTAAFGSDAKYSRGAATLNDSIENLDIDWTAGKVEIAYHADNTITLEETAKRAIAEDEEMRWQVDGTTLRIIFEKPGRFSFTSQEKTLTVTLPEGTRLKTAAIKATSADLEIPALEGEEITLETTSGDIHAGVTAKKVKGSSTSGDMRLTLNGRPDSVTLGATSGGILAEAEEAGTMKIGTTSGSVQVNLGHADSLEIGSTSGNIYTDMKQIGKAGLGSTSGSIHVKAGGFEQLKIEAISGSVEAALPATPGFSGTVSTSSGDVICRMPLMKDGERYTCGDGSGKLEIHTTSGDVTILEAE